jgi:hypothetical protein
MRAKAANATQLDMDVTPAAKPAAQSASTHSAATASFAYVNLMMTRVYRHRQNTAVQERTPDRTPPLAPRIQSNPFGKDHLPNLFEHQTRRRILERAIVDKPFTKTGWSSPASHRRRLVPMGHVDMKATVADLKKYDLTVVCQRTVCRESSDRCLQSLDLCRP